jgi:tetratricopeptide (TPR) repeat protein
LLETIRQYAREKLAESGEGEQIRARHLDCFLKLVQRGENNIYGAGQAEWLQKLEDEHENLNAALEWSLQGNVTSGQQLTASLWWAWNEGGHNSEIYSWLERMLAATPGDETLVVAKLLSGVGWLTAKTEDRKNANQKSVTIFRKLGDEIGAAFPLSTLGILAYLQSDYERAIQLFEESVRLFKAGGNKWGVRHMMGTLGYTAEAQENYVQAQKYYEESLLISKEIEDQDGIAWTLYLMAMLVESSQGDNARAVELYDEALKISKAVKAKPVTSMILQRLGIAFLQRGDYERSRLLFEEELEINRKTGNRPGVSYGLNSLGWCARLQGDYRKARSYYSDGLQLIKQSGDDDGIANYLVDVGILLGVEGHPENFARLLGLAEGLFPNIMKMLIPFSRTETEQYIETARAALGDDAYTAAYEAGKKMSLDEAVVYTFKELGQ